MVCEAAEIHPDRSPPSVVFGTVFVQLYRLERHPKPDENSCYWFCCVCVCRCVCVFVCLFVCVCDRCVAARQDCAPGYVRRPSGQYLGQCVEQAAECPRGEYGDPARGIPCQQCPCLGGSGQLVLSRPHTLRTLGIVCCRLRTP